MVTSPLLTLPLDQTSPSYPIPSSHMIPTGMAGFGGSLSGARDNSHGNSHMHGKGRGGGGGDSASVSSQGSSSTTAMGIQLGGGMPRIKGGSNTPPRRGNPRGGGGGRAVPYGQSNSLPGPGTGSLTTPSLTHSIHAPSDTLSTPNHPSDTR